MTLQELSRLFQLKERLARDVELLENLQSVACPRAQVFTDIPHKPGITDKVGNLSAEIADIKLDIQHLHLEIELEEKRAVFFIKSVTDEQMRIILRLRFLHCYAWKDVAVLIGGKNTEESVKTACYRFLKKNKI